MKSFLKEVVTGFTKIDDEQPKNVTQDDDLDDLDGLDLDDVPPENSDNMPEDADDLADLDNDGIETQDEDPNKQGLIRTVKQAHLVYKRQNEEGDFEELWIYNVTDMKNGMDIRKRILAGTDIPVAKTTSPDGVQSYKIWSVGNAELLQITGLSN